MDNNWKEEAAGGNGAQGAAQGAAHGVDQGVSQETAGVSALPEDQMDALYGEWNNSIDDKGRLSFPVRLKSALSSDSVVLVKGINRCVWMFSPEVWKEKAAKITAIPWTAAGAPSMKRHFLGSAAESEVDKSGRLPIPQNLREYAHLNRDCKVLGLGNKVEIWDAASYDSEDISAIAAQFNVF